MARLKIRTVGNGQHPSEAVVAVTTADGKTEELIVDRRSITDNSVKIGYPISARGTDELLVELPRESLRGSWRIWVRRSDVEEAAA